MAKINITDKIFTFVPITTQTILGSHVRSKVNFMALGWLTAHDCHRRQQVKPIS
jgi:hypothetical protein